jgi:hypothetical protein
MKEATAKFLETIRSSSANYVLSIHAIFSQTRKIATIPLLKTNTLIQGKYTRNAQMCAVTFLGKSQKSMRGLVGNVYRVMEIFRKYPK